MIKCTDRVNIYFFLDGERYAYRRWLYVPRVGDEIMLFTRSDDQKMPFVAKRVVWGVEGPDEQDLGMQAVNIDIEPAP